MNSAIICGRTLTRALVSGVCSYSSSTCTSTQKPSDSESDVRIGINLTLPWKREKEKPKKKLCLLTASCGFPKDWKGFTTAFIKHGRFGDDASFITRHKSSDVLGVADGVGGWRTYGIDPSHFSYALMKTCERIVQTGHFNATSPSGIISAGYYELLENKEHIIGSSTACVLILNQSDHTVYAANIGDSGFLIVRHGRIVHRSQEQQHYFNTPFQLSLAPPGVGDMVLNDSPDSAESSSFSVEVGDLILLATDGLFDNLTDKAIVQQLAMLKEHTLENIQKAVNSLALQARRLAFDATYLSPFSQRARDNGIDILGGKPDDITVLLASVGQSQSDQTVISQSDYG